MLRSVLEGAHEAFQAWEVIDAGCAGQPGEEQHEAFDLFRCKFFQGLRLPTCSYSAQVHVDTVAKPDVSPPICPTSRTFNTKVQARRPPWKHA